MIRIITDSSTLYNVEEAKAAGFDSIPLHVIIGDMDGRDMQIDMNDFYTRIQRGEIPSSSQPSIGEVLEMFNLYAGDDIINISMADGLSGTYQSACGAREISENRDNITVFNCMTVCGPQRYMVEKAQKMVQEGKTKEEILKWLEYIKTKTESYLIPQDFAFLKRGGRLTPMAAALGSALKLKPIMTLTEDCKKLDKFAVKRTMKAAVGVIIDQLKKSNLDERHIIYVVHGDAPEDAQNVADQLKENFPKAEIQIYQLSPVLVTQGGPKCIAVQFIER